MTTAKEYLATLKRPMTEIEKNFVIEAWDAAKADCQGGQGMNAPIEVSWTPNEIEWLQKWLKWLKDAPLMVTEQDKALARVWIKKLEIQVRANGCCGIGLGK